MAVPLHKRDRLPVQDRVLRTRQQRNWRDTWNRMRSRSAPVRDHITDHGFSWAAMAFIDAACFVHSEFTGLLVTGILLFLFELKIGD